MVFDARKRAEQAKNAQRVVAGSPGDSESASPTVSGEELEPAGDRQLSPGLAKDAAPQQAPVVRSLLRIKRPEPARARRRLLNCVPQDDEADRTIVIARENPLYPEMAKQRLISGRVEVRFRIGPDGAVYDAQSVKGPPILARAAIEVVEAWSFEPAKRNGTPIVSQAVANFEFDLAERV